MTAVNITVNGMAMVVEGVTTAPLLVAFAWPDQIVAEIDPKSIRMEWELGTERGIIEPLKAYYPLEGAVVTLTQLHDIPGNVEELGEESA
jgi:hypothetical protein